MSATHNLFWRESHALAQLGSHLHTPLEKTLVAKYMEETFPLCQEGVAMNAELKKTLAGLG
jgi:hypothetical protein